MSEHVPCHVLVTGGAGFIGSNLIRHLLAGDPSLWLVNLDLLTYAGSPANLEGLPDPHRHRFVQGDVGDGPLVARLLREHRIDTVIHLAAETHVDRSIVGPGAFIRTNVLGTFTLLEEARRYWLDERGLEGRSARFHHVSTDEVYGSLGRDARPSREGDPYAPSSPYAASKAGSDHLVRAYHRTYGLPVTLTNCSNNYGAWQHPEKFIPTVVRACIARAPIPIYGDGSNIRDWLHVLDHCRAIEAVVRRGRPGESYNVGDENVTSNLELARRMCRILDEQLPAGAPHERLLSFVPDRLGHDWRYTVSAEKLRREVGWAPAYPFADGLARVVDWYRRRFQEGQA